VITAKDRFWRPSMEAISRPGSARHFRKPPLPCRHHWKRVPFPRKNDTASLFFGSFSFTSCTSATIWSFLSPVHSGTETRSQKIRSRRRKSGQRPLRKMCRDRYGIIELAAHIDKNTYQKNKPHLKLNRRWIPPPILRHSKN
jgi:hypothetical protein